MMITNSPSDKIPTPSTPGTAIEAITSPFGRFARMEAAGGIVLLASTILALVWSNSPWHQSYEQFFQTHLSVGFGKFVLTENRHEWINDGLMSLFFFLVGLEIKREILVGELSSLRKAAFPFMAALGGMVVPAGIYLAVVHHQDYQSGWAIPLSTDIAFTLGLLTFFGSRIPVTLRVFVTALAIVDDIFAVAVIAIFYSDQIHYVSLAVGVGCVLVSMLMNLLGVRKPAVYAAIGIVVWWAVLKSGVHATVAGILLAFTIPARTFLEKSEFLTQGRWLLDRLEAAPPNSFEEHSVIHTLEVNVQMVESPLHRIEHELQPWISFLVMPLFALANAGVDVTHNVAGAAKHPVSFGIAFGLFLGKPAGILLFSFLAARTHLGVAPEGVSWRQIFGASWLCGIGFTMSLFIAGLAFDDVQLLSISKIAILAASLLSGIGGCFVLARSGTVQTAQPTPQPELKSA
jgi:Na+:H+ antiporter, NhaA family